MGKNTQLHLHQRLKKPRYIEIKMNQIIPYNTYRNEVKHNFL